jgi:nitrogen regulatory protein P-II 1
MKSITVLVPPTKLTDIKEAIWEIGIEFMTVTNVMVCGPKSGRSESHPIPSADEDYLNKAKIEIMISNDLVDTAIEALRRGNKKSGPAGDGTIIVTDIPNLVNISPDTPSTPP